MSKFMTIRQAAADPRCPLREGTLRSMVRHGECPGYYSGTRFWVDVDGLAKKLSGAVEVVRCKDCEYCVDHHEKAYCNHDLGLIGIVEPDFYCSYGERRTDGSTK